jgi:probable rRNA maturation factor
MTKRQLIIANHKNLKTRIDLTSDIMTEPDIVIEIAIDADQWSGFDGDDNSLHLLATKACQATRAWLIQHENQPFPKDGSELSLLFTDDLSIKSINHQWRGMDKPTNVLSFPSLDIAPGELPQIILGDIIFAFETIEREANELQKPFDEHLIHLFIHGFLHLFGYDHIEDNDGDEMEAIETGIMVSLGLSDPYGGNVPPKDDQLLVN